MSGKDVSVSPDQSCDIRRNINILDEVAITIRPKEALFKREQISWNIKYSTNRKSNRVHHSVNRKLDPNYETGTVQLLLPWFAI